MAITLQGAVRLIVRTLHAWAGGSRPRAVPRPVERRRRAPRRLPHSKHGRRRAVGVAKPSAFNSPGLRCAPVQTMTRPAMRRVATQLYVVRGIDGKWRQLGHTNGRLRADRPEDARRRPPR
jgi:hypothetical protein